MSAGMPWNDSFDLASTSSPSWTPTEADWKIWPISLMSPTSLGHARFQVRTKSFESKILIFWSPPPHEMRPT